MGSITKFFTKAGSKGGRRAAQPSRMTTYEIGDATKLKTGGGRRSAVPGKRQLSDIDLEEIDEGIKMRKDAAPKPRRRAPPKPMSRTPKAGKMQGAYNEKKAELQKLEAMAKNLSKGPELTAIKEKIQLVTNAMEGIAKRNPSIKRNKGGKVLYKKHGGMTHVGLSPAEEARSGTMSEAKRARYMQAGGYLKDIQPKTTWEQFKKKHPDSGITKKGFESLKPNGIYHKKVTKNKLGKPKFRRTYGGLEPIEREAKMGGPIHTTFSKQADPRTEGRKTAVDLFPKVEREAKKGGKVGKKKQGYKARKDESIAMRVKKKRTKKQLKASRHESYGKPGSGKGKGKINRVSSKQTDGNKLVASLYD
jgi:hypothetical protein